jgi:hypothetical protein
MEKNEIHALYKTVSGFRNDCKPKQTTDWKSIYTSRMEADLLEQVLPRLAKMPGFPIGESQILAPLFWLMPECSDQSRVEQAACTFADFMSERTEDRGTFSHTCMAAIAFGCGWRPSNGSGEFHEAWFDALDELTLCIMPSIQKALRALQSLGIPFRQYGVCETEPIEGTNSKIYQWSRFCVLALADELPKAIRGTFGPSEGGLSKFQGKDCSRQDYFLSQVNYHLVGLKNTQSKQSKQNRKSTDFPYLADSFSKGLLWHALRTERIDLGPPANRFAQGWIRFTEAMAMRWPAGNKGDAKQLEIGRDGFNLAEVDVVVARKGIYWANRFVELKFWAFANKLNHQKNDRAKSQTTYWPVPRVKGQYQEKRPKDANQRVCHLQVRLADEAFQTIAEAGDFCSEPKFDCEDENIRIIARP